MNHPTWTPWLLALVPLLAGCPPADELLPDVGLPPAACPERAGPTLHARDVTSDEVWTAAGSPHVIEGDVDVVNGATLRIEPCAEVQLGAASHLRIAFPSTPNRGALVAEGTATQPITFKAATGASWASLFVHAPGAARLSWVTFTGGGGGSFEDGATIRVVGGAPGEPLLFVDHVTITQSRGTGVSFAGAAAFMPGSRDLTISGSGGEENAFPLTVSEHALGSVPSGSYTGNRSDEILIDPVGTGVAGEGIVFDQVLRDYGVPYRVGRWSGDSLLVGGREGSLATLTIEAGVVLKFEPRTALKVQSTTTALPSTAALRAMGTAERPVVFTSAAPMPSPGDWRGLWFGGRPQASNRLEFVRIEYAGSDCACSLVSCSTISESEGAVIFTAQPAGGFIFNSTFKAIAGHGVVQGFDGVLVDFKSSNHFVDVAGCQQTHPRNADTTCPSPRPACD